MVTSFFFVDERPKYQGTAAEIIPRSVCWSTGDGKTEPTLFLACFGVHMAVSKKSKSASTDPIRIVPLHAGNIQQMAFDVAFAAPAAQLTYRKGPLISGAQVFTLFWGSAWTKAPQKILIDQLNAFFDVILTSPLIDQLSEYNAGRYKITHGRRTGSATVTTGSPGTSVTDSAIQTFLEQQIAKRVAPKVTANTLYFIFVPPGVRVVMGGAASCQAFCGYHNAIGRKTFYAVMPYPGCSGCTGSLTPFESLTSTSSHELCEAITDPIPGAGWYDDIYGEIGDICGWQTKKIGQYVVQLEWSNKSNRCV
jgi:hypothetical protein